MASPNTHAPPPSIKERKESFVSGLTGGPILEVYVCTFIAISSYITWSILQSRLGFFTPTLRPIPTAQRSGKLGRLANLLSLATVVDVALNWLTSLLSITIYASEPVLLNISVLLPALIVLFTNKRKTPTELERSLNEQSKTPSKKEHKEAPKNASDKNDDTSLLKSYLPHHSFLSVYRGQMMILTCLAIIAVDFRVFPRRFAKVETWGTSMMDLGVGSFVFSMGLVSSRATLTATFNKKNISSFALFLPTLIKTLRGIFTVLCLGLVRLFLVKSLEYQEHVTEYGVHWNFFMTLGLLPLFVNILDFLVPPRRLARDTDKESPKVKPKTPFTIPTVVVALLIAVIYEYLLDKQGLAAYIIVAPRVNLIAQNKEGIFSFIGYLSIFLFGKATGYYALPSNASLKSLWYPQTREEFVESQQKTSYDKAGSRARRRRVYLLLASSVVFHLLYFVCRRWLRLQVSRRFANLPYVLWTVSYNTLNLALFALVELCVFATPGAYPYEMRVPASVDSVNSSGLFIFLLANVSTGLINMSVNTLDAPPQKALAVLSAYALFLYMVGTLLKQFNIVIRL